MLIKQIVIFVSKCARLKLKINIQVEMQHFGSSCLGLCENGKYLIVLPIKFVLFVTSEQRRLLVFVVWESDHQFKILQCLDCTICFNFQKKKIDKYNHSQRILPEVKVDVHRWRGMEQLMMGLPREPKSRPARPAVGLQPPKLKVKIKEIIQCRAEYEILIFYLSNWTDPGPVFKWQLINHNCVRLTSNSNCHLCWL